MSRLIAYIPNPLRDAPWRILVSSDQVAPGQAYPFAVIENEYRSQEEAEQALARVNAVEPTISAMLLGGAA